MQRLNHDSWSAYALDGICSGAAHLRFNGWLSEFRGKSGLQFRCSDKENIFVIDHRWQDCSYSADRIGGCNVTGRNSAEIRERWPEGLAALESFAFSRQNGRIVFAGNGTSPVPSELVRNSRFRDGKEVIICDVFDYQALAEDLTLVNSMAVKYGIQPKYASQAECVRRLLEDVEAGKLKTARYVIGSGDPPLLLTGADIIFNFFGPAQDTLADQIALLKRGGRLLYNRSEETRRFSTSRYSCTPFFRDSGKSVRGAVYTRIV